jgi:DNA-binding Xre family transcriptional regulator
MAKTRPMMEARGYKKFDLRRMGFSPAIVDKVLSGKLDGRRRVDTVTINRLCAVLEWQPGAIMEYLPDEGEEGKA